MTQTALEWLIEQLTRLFNQLEIGEIQIDEYKYYLNLIIQQAKEMEKQQKAKDWQEGYNACEFHNDYENLQKKQMNNPFKIKL